MRRLAWRVLRGPSHSPAWTGLLRDRRRRRRYRRPLPCPLPLSRVKLLQRRHCLCGAASTARPASATFCSAAYIDIEISMISMNLYESL
jgi:hypothetical protein